MRVLMVEDDGKLASVVIKGLRDSGFVVDRAEDGDKGFQLAQAETYDVAIIDVMLPKLDGLSLIRKMRENSVNLPVLILSAKRSVKDKVKGLQNGGDDYLTKPFSFSELQARLQALIRRNSGASDPTMLKVGDLTMNLLSREIRRGWRDIELQPREFSLLEYLMRNAGRVVSKEMIMEHVWDYNFDPQTNIVEARICKLREKLVADNDLPQMIHTVRGVGYVLKEARN